MFSNTKTESHFLKGLASFFERTHQNKKSRGQTLTLKKPEDVLENFAYVASHDLKAPLRAIDNIASWIAEDLAGNMEDHTKKHILLLKNRVNRMERFLNDLLTYSTIGKKDAIIETINLNSLLDEIIFMINPPKTISIKYNNYLPSIKTYKIPLQQIFMNLLSNAVKHCNQKNLIIEISYEDFKDHYKFHVKDNGPGIPSQHQKKAFQLFQTLNSRDKIEGSGMGLAIVKKAVESNGGSVMLRSSKGIGSLFSFTWPKNIKNTFNS